jgi:hypothetical protein
MKYFQQLLLTTTSGTPSPLASDMKVDKVIQHNVTFIPNLIKLIFHDFQATGGTSSMLLLLPCRKTSEVYFEQCIYY